MADLVLLVHAAATLVMVGVIWFVQVVHYPLFVRVGPSGFSTYSGAHSRLTGYVVGPPMLVEMATAIPLLVVRPIEVPAYGAWIGLLLQVPRHRVLVLGFDTAAWSGLVLTNWLRTASWSLRGLLVLWMLSRVMS